VGSGNAVSFWDFFFLLLIYVPLLLLWGTALVDIFRRNDMGGASKALWVVAVILVPFFGTLLYLILRPAGATSEERRALDAASRDLVSRYTPDNPAQQLAVLADLQDRGKLTDEEFTAEKARILGAAPAAVPVSRTSA
jgi:hypothetical protein